MDNYAAHKRVEICDWLAANPRVHVHFTPTSATWMNLVEVWFGIIERQAIRRGTYRSVRGLNAKIRASINGWNDRSHPFVWTKPAEEILAKADRKQRRRRTTRSLGIRTRTQLVSLTSDGNQLVDSQLLVYLTSKVEDILVDDVGRGIMVISPYSLVNLRTR
jgi:hypothetical protein